MVDHTLRLIKALRLSDSPKLALIGAGGKTTAMFRLAVEILEHRHKTNQIPTVILYSPFRLLPINARLADLHLKAEEESDIPPLYRKPPPGIIALTEITNNHNQTKLKKSSIIDKIYALVEKYQLPFFLELDTSNQRTVKALLEYEENIPSWVDLTIIMAGLQAIGKPIDTKWVYKPDIVAELCKQPVGSIITENTLAKMLNHPKDNPTHFTGQPRRICLLNQADNKQLLEVSKRISKNILAKYDAVISASLMPDLRKSILIPHQDEVKYVHEATAGIILAAGSANRMGALKQTLPINGIPSIKIVADTAINSGLSPVIVVTGAENSSVEQHISDMNVKIVFNPDWKNGMSTSVKTAINSLPPETGSAVFMLCDQPLISVSLITKIVETRSKTMAPIIAPYSDGVRGNPILFGRTTFKDLLIITGDIGGKAIFSKYPIQKITWEDPSSFFDMDTPEDYKKIKSIAGKKNKL
jgi:molybdenum cofactor cytidylyltransferase